MLLLLLLTTLFASSGCQLNRSFFQMDSNSRVPFFGVDLKPKWPKRTSSVDGVSRLQSEAAQVTRTETEETSKPPRKHEPLRLPVAEASTSTGSIDVAPIERFR